MGFLLSWFLTTEAAICVVTFVFFIVAYRTLSSPRINFPPGPPSLPIIGNVLQIPADSQEEVFTEWGKQYGSSSVIPLITAFKSQSEGDIVYIKIFKQPMIIINDLQAARDLLDKRSTIYSDRPRFVLLSEL